MQHIFLSDKQVAKRYSVSRATVWRWHRERSDFPRAVKVSDQCTRWRLAEIEDWEKAQSGG